MSRGQIERHFRQGDLNCSHHFLYGTMLREPLRLIESAVNYNAFDVKAVVRWLKSSPSSPTGCGAPCKHHGHKALSWQLFDNFAVRSFNGLTGWTLLPGQVGEEHLQVAKERVSQMDVILTLEALDENYWQLVSVFNWKPKNQTTKSNKHYHRVRIAGPELQYLEKLNYYDKQLYQFAQQLEVARKEEHESEVLGT